ncbi:MAG TPA: hypothetical protein VKX45_14790 [Bryobacteraceae bacterium]|nr:hypothetical protein [Bryobacteraceae bacterium]
MEKLVAGEVLALANDARQAAIGELYVVLLAALAAETEHQTSAVDADVAVAHGGQAEGLVLPCVFIVAHADERGLEQPHDRRQHLLARQAGTGEVLLHAAPDHREHGAERNHPGIFCLVAYSPVERVIPVLLPSLCIPAICLQVTVRRGADPDIPPCRRDD